MRSTWTDSRLDDFAAHTDRRFDAVDQRFNAVDQRFDAVDRRFDTIERRMESGFSQVTHEVGDLRGEVSGLQRTMVHTTVALAAGMLAGFGGLAG